ncbi:anaerobic benzoate catabolism transcriptional regulator [Tsuneonella dongtanensis]|uniref:Anaerobic benzoate catabolism transcriptional regulator n=2 Tax=Tsuneonella dongtanensis TaxID=692370 RepID=A0A1B2A947_9SPHN|nr:anaerobic benzoate catabolism transcriptional regulator [Tsuneonella dongtanensis]
MRLRQNLAANIRRIRSERGLSQDNFAALVDVHRTYVNHLEQARRNLTIDVIERMADRLEIDPCALIADPKKSGEAR